MERCQEELKSSEVKRGLAASAGRAFGVSTLKSEFGASKIEASNCDHKQREPKHSTIHRDSARVKQSAHAARHPVSQSAPPSLPAPPTGGLILLPALFGNTSKDRLNGLAQLLPEVPNLICGRFLWPHGLDQPATDSGYGAEGPAVLESRGKH